MSKQKRTLEQIKADLDAAKAKLKEVQEKGDAAISAYDLRLGYDADFYLNRCPILQNHVSSFERELRNYLMLNNQLTIF